MANVTRDELIDDGMGTEIADDALAAGCRPVQLADNGLTGDHRLVLWDCGGARVIDTNGLAVWEDSDPEGFVELLRQIGGVR